MLLLVVVAVVSLLLLLFVFRRLIQGGRGQRAGVSAGDRVDERVTSGRILEGNGWGSQQKQKQGLFYTSFHGEYFILAECGCFLSCMMEICLP